MIKNKTLRIFLISLILILFLGLTGNFLLHKVRTNISGQTPDELIVQLKEICATGDYKTVVLSSLKKNKNSYSPITKLDLFLDSDGYVNSAIGLCSVITSTSKLTKIKTSSNKWEYRYINSEISSSNSLGLVQDNGAWKFVLDLGLTL